MQFFLIYIFESSILASVAYLLYRYLFFKLAYFEWSRFFLLGSVLLGFILPLLPILQSESEITILQENSFFIDTFFNQGFVNVQHGNDLFQTDFFSEYYVIELIFSVWILFFAKSIFQLFLNLFSLYRKMKNAKIEKKKQYVVVFLKDCETAFSFFNYIFINEKKYNLLTKSQRNQIFEHEKVHANKKHTFDNLLFSLISSAFWFNSLAKKIIPAIREIHEFSVDAVVSGGKIKTDYSTLILHLASKTPIFAKVSHFSVGKIKNRITLLANPETEKLRKKRFLFSFPAICALYFVFYFVSSSVNATFRGAPKQTIIFEKGTYKLVTPFFENKKYIDNQTKQKKYLSHKEITFEVKDNSQIFAPKQGLIIQIDTLNNWGVKELNISVKSSTKVTYIIKSVKICVKQIGDSVYAHEEIAIAGTQNLYPTVSFVLIKEGAPTDPTKFITEKNVR